MEPRRYPKAEMSAIRTSTIVRCETCGGETRMYEEVYTDGSRYYHAGCAPKRAAYTKTTEQN